MHKPFASGNGNGNKMNLRIEILENLLNASGDGTSAKINSLKQAIRRNKSDMADNTAKSLDVLRQVFQHEMNEEIKHIIDRHLRTTFAPAFENLKSNGHDVSQSDIDFLCISILDGAKKPFSGDLEKENPNKCIPSFSVLKNFENIKSGNEFSSAQIENNLKIYESDDNESDGSIVSHNSLLSGFLSTGYPNPEQVHLLNRPKKRGRPRKMDADSGRSGTPIIHGLQPVTIAEANNWNPERLLLETRFILGSKANKTLASIMRTHIFQKYSRVLRYIADDIDKAWLFDRSISSRISGKIFFMVLDDVLEIARMENASPQIQNELQRCSFNLPEQIIQKIKNAMQNPFKMLQMRVIH